jgi:hypothetical protein
MQIPIATDKSGNQATKTYDRMLWNICPFVFSGFGRSFISRVRFCSGFDIYNPRAGGAKRRARVLIPPGYLHPGKRKH